MKKTYLQPSTAMVIVRPTVMICTSQDITSNDGSITYGGVDEDGGLDPASRRRDMWEDEDSEE